MKVEYVWAIFGIIGGTLAYSNDKQIWVGAIIMAVLGFIVTSIMKMFNWKFANSSNHSSSSRDSYSSCDSWDD